MFKTVVTKHVFKNKAKTIVTKHVFQTIVTKHGGVGGGREVSGSLEVGKQVLGGQPHNHTTT